jgi:hypothetical protein
MKYIIYIAVYLVLTALFLLFNYGAHMDDPPDDMS